LAGIAYFYVNPEQNIAPKTILLLTTITGFGLIAIWRFIYNKFITIKLTYKVLFAGLTDDVKELIEQIKKEPQLGYQIAGILLYEKDSSYTQSAAYAQSHNISVYTSTSLRDNLSQINIVVLSPVMAANTSLLQTLYQSLFQGISIVELSDFYESVMHRIPPFTFSEGWFIAHLQEQQKKIYDRIRILSDYFLGACLGLLCTATLPFIALAIKLNSKGKVFFTQNRVGRGGAIFKVYKFRTMKSLSTDGSAETNGPQYAATADMRITSVGKFLRLTRLDETPQFINILKGEMSFIGPRPERPEFVAQLTEKMPFYSLRHLIKPGLTGWAQVQKSYYGTIEENLQKLEYDLFYIKNRNFTLDVSILLRTISTILRMAGR
jgi:exopolysaccharide biosynthesis polyprenyl glycosylphosphotransferase